MQSANAHLGRAPIALANVERYMSNDATILAFTSIWETASTASTAFSHTLSKDKSSSQNLQRKSVANSTMKTTVPKATNAAFPMTFGMRPACITPWESANFQPRPVAFLTKRKLMSVCLAFFTLWEGARTTHAKTSTV